MARAWDFMVTCYYHNGEIAIQTVHKGESSKDTEVAASNRRSDIGRVEVRDLRKPPPPRDIPNGDQ